MKNEPTQFIKQQEGLPVISTKNNRLKKALFYAKWTINTIVLILSIYGFVQFFRTYGLQSPILFRSPFYIIKQEAIINGKAKDHQSAIFNLGKIADSIYQLESSSGKNDGCTKLGLFNGYGYRQNSFEWICYSSHEEVRSHVIAWLEANIKSGNIEKALCLYNQGKITDTCAYAINYQSIK